VSGRETGAKLLAAHRAIMADQMSTPLANQKKARDTAERMLESITKRIDSAVTIANTERNVLLAKLSSPAKPKDIAAAMLASEIRACLARLSPAERTKAIGEALKLEDDSVISAVLNAPSVVSGVSKSEADLLRVSYAQQRFPGDVDRTERLDKALEDLLRGGRAMITLVASLSNRAQIAEAEASERAAKAAQALANA
jgi:hypothetical protein